MGQLSGPGSTSHMCFRGKFLTALLVFFMPILAQNYEYFFPQWGRYTTGPVPHSFQQCQARWTRTQNLSRHSVFSFVLICLLAEVEFCRGQRNHYCFKVKFNDILIVILHCFIIKQLKIGNSFILVQENF